MSLPNYLARIKSAGMYRFTFDKSQVAPAAAETMRLVVGYSEKGPFNNPIYIESRQEFLNLFGNINKRLEKKGVFFHRMALQALSAGPILALNIKPFAVAGEDGTQEQVDYITFTPNQPEASELFNNVKAINVLDIYDRDRFWKIDANQLATKINKDLNGTDEDKLNGYINIAATDVKEHSCSLFIRRCNDTSVKGYDITLADWYKSSGEEMPEYLFDVSSMKVKDFFAEVYVFHGQFTDDLVGTVNGNDGALAKYFVDVEDENGNIVKCIKPNYTNKFNTVTDALTALSMDENSNFIGVYRGCLLPYFRDLSGNYISLDLVFNADRETHKMIMKLDDALIDDMFEADTTGEIKCALTDWVNPGWDASGINTAIAPIYIKGYEYNTITRKTTAKKIYDDVFDVMINEKGIYDALTNHVDSEYHYLVDTFATIVSESGAEVGCGKKGILADIAKTKDNCLAIMNAPSMDAWKNGITNFNIEDLEKGTYKHFFTLPEEVDGASHCAFYTPLVFGEGLVRTTVPSAALVSNNFMEKWRSRQPYYIVAGPNYGAMSYSGLVGPDYNYSRADLDVFEPMGINCMVYVPRKGTYINSNQTAKQTPVSALSKVHVRELVIYLQNEIENLLQSYQWEMNTQVLRDTIKTSADAILERVKNNGGVYAYLNVCDSSNNTPEVIDNEMIILDTSIEPARGAGKMVQRLTIHKTGGISSSIG